MSGTGKKCRVLYEYAKFVDISRQYLADGIEQNEALNMAIDHDILSDFLRKNRAEVLGMLLEEFDVKKYEKTLREEGDAARLVKSVEEFMKRMDISANEACYLIGAIEQYQEAKGEN